MRVEIPWARFGKLDARVEAGEDASHVDETGSHKRRGAIKYIDVIFYSGEEKKINFREEPECGAALAIEISDKELSGERASIKVGGGEVTVTRGDLSASGSVGAKTVGGLLSAFKAEIDSKDYRELF